MIPQFPLRPKMLLWGPKHYTEHKKTGDLIYTQLLKYKTNSEHRS